jgi:hypothetical protein
VKTTSILPAVLALLCATAGAAAAKKSWGVMLDAGVPDGASGALVYRPWGFLRLHAGVGSNSIGTGVRGGLSLMALGLSANVDAGRYFPGNANPLASKITGDLMMDVPALRRVGYDYVNFHGGLEWGATGWGTFYIHGGMSRLRGVVHELGETISSNDVTVSFAHDPTVKVWVVSARVGIIIYFL